MSLEAKDVARIARLARLEIPQDELVPLARELNAILNFVEQLGQVEVKDVPPLTSVVAAKLKMREDKVSDGGDAAAVLRNAPATEGDFFVVPRVVE